MRLLCLSNGHGEDAIAVRILQALRQQTPAPDVAALPIVGEGHAYFQSDIPCLAPVRSMPSGGFIYMDGRQLAKDLRGGLLQLTWRQIRAVRTWARKGGAILAVGDIVPLLFAWWSGAPYAFVGTAKSDYYLRDEAGLLPRRNRWERLENWSGSVYLPWERWLMSRPRCRAVFPRDSLTAEILQQWPIPAFDLGNPMMDGVSAGAGAQGAARPMGDVLTILLLPGSRAPEAYRNWDVILKAVEGVIETTQRRSLRFLAAIAPGLALEELGRGIESFGWRSEQGGHLGTAVLFHRPQRPTITLELDQSHFSDYLQAADFAIAMAGTATEQFVGLGKAAITLPGQGPQFTPAFAEAQTRLLGPSVSLVETPDQVASTLQALLADPDRLQLIAQNGWRRMGKPGAGERIAECLRSQLLQQG